MATGVTSYEVRRWRDRVLDAARPTGADDAARVDLLSELELLKSAVCVAQADLAVALDDSVRSRDAAEGVPAVRRGRGVAAQVALARRTSPHQGQVLLGLARDLDTDLPHTRVALREGRLDERTALLLARELGCLDRTQRLAVDEDLCADPDVLAGCGTARVVAEARRRVCAADPGAVVRRVRRAAAERRVSLRPAPDTMAYLTALLPVAQGVAAFAALSRDADTARATTGAGARSRGQVMADLLVERLTGQARAQDVPVSVDLVVSDATLLGAGADPGLVPGFGPVPAQVARELVAASLERDHDGADSGADGAGCRQAPTWLRRIYTDPAGRVVAASSRARFTPAGLAAVLRVRDQGLCRTPWCDAPARHDDHVTAVADGGATTEANTQALCEACNHAKQAPGWRAREVAGPRHTVETTTPTGHRYRSRAPSPPRPAAPAARRAPHPRPHRRGLSRLEVETIRAVARSTELRVVVPAVAIDVELAPAA